MRTIGFDHSTMQVTGALSGEPISHHLPVSEACVSALISQPSLVNKSGNLNPGFAISRTPIMTNNPSGTLPQVNQATSFVTGASTNLIGEFCARNQFITHVTSATSTPSSQGGQFLQPCQVGTLPTSLVMSSTVNSKTPSTSFQWGGHLMQTPGVDGIPFSSGFSGRGTSASTVQS